MLAVVLMLKYCFDWLNFEMLVQFEIHKVMRLLVLFQQLPMTISQAPLF
jgi:hypothetical protein